ncbi:scaffolding protein [Sporolactobacillus sp. THM7-7]|nr:scaffolding protein [Sporolactobacillus sp. THM7-7]
MHVHAEKTPNPNAMKFTFDVQRFDSRIEVKNGEATGSPLLDRLLAVEGVDNLFGYRNFLTVNKTESASWDELLPKIREVFAES